MNFLENVSRTLHEDDPCLPDLSVDHRFSILPLKGGNLIHTVQLNLFRNFRKPEFHLYDRDENGTYQDEVNTINERTDGSRAVETIKRYMESYLHPDAISRIMDIKIVIDDESDVVAQMSQGNGGAKAVKKKLSKEVSAEMTAEEIDERDGNEEIRGWLRTLATMAE